MSTNKSYFSKNDTLIYNFNPKDPAYAYRFGKGEFKIYFPFRKEYRFLSNTSVLQGLKQFEPSLIGLITKSYKDVICLKTFGINSLAPSSESHLIPKEQWLNIKHLAEHWFSLMDYDRAGILMAQKLSEYHSGYRAFSRDVFNQIDLSSNSDDFIFDNQMIAQILYSGVEIAEITCPTRYFKEASSINFSRSVKYGLGVVKVSLQYRLNKWNLIKSSIFKRIAN